jgi:cell wall-associated NlpC family hydrolase
VTNIELLRYWAQAQLNVPYRWGGQSWKSTDCSGFVKRFLAVFGIDPPGDQNALRLYEMFCWKPNAAISENMSIDQLPARPGDLLFYGYRRLPVPKVGHIAIALSNTHLIEAGGGDSKVKTVDDAELADACVRIRPINHRRDLVGVARLRAFDVVPQAVVILHKPPMGGEP